MPDTEEFLPERRNLGGGVSEYRLTRVEDEMKDTNRKLDSLDTKLDDLRKDLFERHPFVPTGIFASEMGALKERVTSLEASNTTTSNNGLVKLGIAAAIMAAIISPIVGALVYHG